MSAGFGGMAMRRTLLVLTAVTVLGVAGCGGGGHDGVSDAEVRTYWQAKYGQTIDGTQLEAVRTSLDGMCDLSGTALQLFVAGEVDAHHDLADDQASIDVVCPARSKAWQQTIATVAG